MEFWFVDELNHSVLQTEIKVPVEYFLFSEAQTSAQVYRNCI